MHIVLSMHVSLISFLQKIYFHIWNYLLIEIVLRCLTLLGSHIWSSYINQLDLALTLALKQTSLLLLTVVQTNPLSSPMLPLRTALELLQRNRALYNLHMTFEYSDNCRIHVLHRCVKGLRQDHSGVKTDWMESGPFEGLGVVDSLVWKSPLVKLVILWVVAGNGRSRWMSEF